MSNNKEPAIKQMGANQRGAPDGYNLDVSGTVGPDYLGQETADVDGHPCDRPGVLSRLPESSDGKDPQIRRMDTGEELPVLLSSNMRADPIEATQGSYTQIVEGECARCGYDRLRVSVHTLAGEAHESCNACGATQNPSRDDDYRMPKTDRERARDERQAGVKMGRLLNRDVYDLETSTGCGAYISLVGENDHTRFRKESVKDLFMLLVEHGDIDLSETINDRLGGIERAELLCDTLPDGLTVRAVEDDE